MPSESGCVRACTSSPSSCLCYEDTARQFGWQFHQYNDDTLFSLSSRWCSLSALLPNSAVCSWVMNGWWLNVSANKREVAHRKPLEEMPLWILFINRIVHLRQIDMSYLIGGVSILIRCCLQQHQIAAERNAVLMQRAVMKLIFPSVRLTPGRTSSGLHGSPSDL